MQHAVTCGERFRGKTYDPERRQRHPDEAIIRQHLLREQLCCFTQSPAVVGEKALVHEIGSGNVFADAQWIQARIRGKLF